MGQLEESLFDIKNVEKEKFSIKIHIENKWTKQLMKKMNVLLFRIMNVLQASNMKQFAFWGKIQSEKEINYEKEYCKQWIETLQSMRLNYKVIIDQSNTMHQFIICNKEFSPSSEPEYIIRVI